MGIYVSESVSYSAGSQRDIAPFVPAIGPRGGRNIITRFEIEFVTQVDTDGSTSFDTEDWASFLKEFIVYDKHGLRYRLSGFWARNVALLQYGAQCPADPASLAVSQSNAARTVRIPIPMAMPRLLRDADTGLPVDELKSITLAQAAISDMQITGTGLTVDSGTWKVYAHTVEEDMSSVEHKSRAVWTTQTMPSTSQMLLPLAGSALYAMFLGKKAAGGGASLSNFTSVDDFAPAGITNIPKAALKAMYQIDSGYASATVDPVLADLLIPVVFPAKNQKLTDLASDKYGEGYFTADPLIRVTNTVSDLEVLMCSIQNRDSNAVRNANVRFNLPPEAAAVVKTAGKSRRDPADFDRRKGLLPAKVRTGRKS